MKSATCFAPTTGGTEGFSALKISGETHFPFPPHNPQITRCAGLFGPFVLSDMVRSGLRMASIGQRVFFENGYIYNRFLFFGFLFIRAVPFPLGFDWILFDWLPRASVVVIDDPLPLTMSRRRRQTRRVDAMRHTLRNVYA